MVAQQLAAKSILLSSALGWHEGVALVARAVPATPWGCAGLRHPS